MNPHILTPEVQHYLLEHELAEPVQVALRKSPFATVSAAELAQQLDARQRCRKKLPLWHDTPGIYYPEKLAVEQASSQATATHKCNLVPKGTRMIDLTGGFGVDTFFFAERAKTVIHCEKNTELSTIAQHNAITLGAQNIDFVTSDGLVYLQGYPDDAFDIVYIDPSRRVAQRKVFRLEDCVPDVVGEQYRLLQKAKRVVIKSAPLLDIASALLVLQRVSEVHIVSINNECKELLFVLDRECIETPLIIATALKKGNTAARFVFRTSEEKDAVADFGYPTGYLYEPDAALLKSGAFKLIGQHYGLKKLHRHTHLYTSTVRCDNFIGKTFQITEVMRYADFKKNHVSAQGNVSTRNFPLKADALRKQHRIREDENCHLFFCTGTDELLLVIFASKC
ncbi:class I SAM-dependent methyltransferase [Parapedobacter pyrenivorans]|uniref:class I SAM-dependent methyltransferase n=1 Tax=Parapedobacter pyrenivorans TaxID=1305674 RepID=UPI00333E7EE7